VRSRRIGATVVFGLLLPILLLAAGTCAAEQASVRHAGERVAAAKGCGTCHALPGEARGNRPGPPFLAPAPPQAPSEMVRRLWNHIPAMRRGFLARGLAWPAFGVEEMADLLAFLGMQRSLERAPDLDRGRALVLQKGCLKCHTLAGEGGRSAPDLTKFRQFRDPVPLAAALWNHAPAMLDRIDQSGIPYPVFQQGEMDDLLGFLGAAAAVSR